MFVTIAICTWNRAQLLDRTLAELAKLEIPRHVRWEVLVVNNRCTDNTDEIIARHQDTLPLRRLYQENAGKSKAANLAVAEAAGDLILWTDDDVLVDPGWLSNYVCAAESYPEAAFFGGAILPWFETKPPRWIVRHMNTISGCFAQRLVPYDDDQPITPYFIPYGANMATRMTCFERCAFDVSIGPLEKTEVRGEDVALIEALLGLGQKGIWVKGASVRHFIAAERMTTKYVWKWFRGYGRTMSRQKPEPTENWTTLFGFPRWMVRRYLENWAWSLLFSPLRDARWLNHFATAAICQGSMAEIKARHSRANLTLGTRQNISGAKESA